MKNGTLKNLEPNSLRIPMNIQFFAESAEASTSGADGGSAEGEGGTEEQQAPTYEELVAQLASERAENVRMKNLHDKASREAAEYKKQLRTKLTAEERESIAKKEADEAKDARIKELEEKMAVIDNTSFWGGKSIGMDESLAKATAEAEASGEKEKFRENIAKFIKSIRETEFQRALKERGEIHAGNGAGDKDTLAKELAVASAKRTGGINKDILKNYRR